MKVIENHLHSRETRHGLYNTVCGEQGRPRADRETENPVKAALAAWCVRKEAKSRCGEEPSRLVAQASERAVHLAVDGKAGLSPGKQAHAGEEPQKQVLHVRGVLALPGFASRSPCRESSSVLRLFS
jgi:hypothetical protein